MKTCPKCGSLFEGKNAFCSRKCSNSRIRTDETKEKIRSKLLGRSVPEDQLKKLISSNQDPERIERFKQSWKLKTEKVAFEDLSWAQKKKRVLEEQNHKCNFCGLDTWNEKPLSLEVDHKDGDRENNERSNLEALCPNCHSQTPTWRKAKKGNREEFPIAEILQYLKDGYSRKRALKEVGFEGSYYSQKLSKILNSGEASL